MTDEQKKLETILFEVIEEEQKNAVFDKKLIPETAQVLIELWKNAY